MPDQLQQLVAVLREYRQQYLSHCPCAAADSVNCEDCRHGSMMALFAHPVVQDALDADAPVAFDAGTTYRERLPRLKANGHLPCKRILNMRHVGLVQWECPRCHTVYNSTEQAYCERCRGEGESHGS